MENLITDPIANGDLKSTRWPSIAFCCIDGAVKSAAINKLKQLPIFHDALIPRAALFSNLERLARLKPGVGAVRQRERTEAFEVELRWAETLDTCVYYMNVIKPLSVSETPIFLGWSAPCLLASLRLVPGVSDSSLTDLIKRLPTPDFTVYIDVNVNEALARIPIADRVEREDLSLLLHRLHQNFPLVLESLPGPVLQVCAKQGTDVTNVIREKLETFLAQWVLPLKSEAVIDHKARVAVADLSAERWEGRSQWTSSEFQTLQTAKLPQRRARIVALCGLDGSGKSSFVERLRQDPGFSHAICVSKRYRENVDSVLDAYSTYETAGDDYLQGPFAEAIRWAYAFDFLRFYEEEVLPHLERDVLIISDRWSACAITYAEAGVYLGSEIYELLNCVPRPDLTIYLEVQPDEAVRRIIKRGDLKKNEHVDILQCCAEAYENWWPKLSSPEARLERVINDDFESAYRRVVALIDQLW
jgi:dTMP kinase